MLDWLLEFGATFGNEMNSMLHTIYWLTVMAFLLVALLIIVLLIKNHTRESRQARYPHANTMVEIVWTIIPVGVFTTLIVLCQYTAQMVTPKALTHQREVQVIATPSRWELLNPGADFKIGAENAMLLGNERHVEVNTVVSFQLNSTDVIDGLKPSNPHLKQVQ